MCGSAPAHPLEVALALWNVAEADQPTGVIFADDACEKHQEDVAGTLFDHAVLMLREQGPLHAKAIKARDRRDAADRAMRSIRPALDAQRAASALDEKNTIDPDLVKREGELAKEIADAEAERVDILTQGTKASDALVAKMKKALKAKKK